MGNTDGAGDLEWNWNHPAKLLSSTITPEREKGEPSRSPEYQGIEGIGFQRQNSRQSKVFAKDLKTSVEKLWAKL